MPNPTLIKGRYYLRLHVPNDLAHKAQGKTLHIPVADQICAVNVGKVVKVSLQTSNYDEAKVRFTHAYASVLKQWEALRNGPVSVPHRTLVALAGQYYRDIVDIVDEEPGETRIWEALEGLHARLDGNETARHSWYSERADAVFAAYGLNADDASKKRLIEELHSAAKQWAALNLRKSQGDYRPDPDAARFPPLPDVQATPKKPEPQTGKLSLLQLFALWEKDHLANGKSPRTIKDFKQKVQSLILFLGHDDALQVTSEAIADWCEDLKHQQGVSARTVSQKYLSVIKLIYQIGVEKKKVKDNPAKDNKVRYEKPKRTRSAGFTDKEAQTILQATFTDPSELGRRSEENKRAIRWLPWICAFTGSRISEAAQLRTEDFFEEYGIPCLRITPDAGSVKTGNFRIVPIHPQLLEMGLLQMVRSLPAGPLFYNLRPHRGVEADPVERAQNAGAKVREWIREDVAITDPRVQPNHAWRHRFKTVAREIGMDVEIRDAIQGHEDGRAASDYGEVTIKAMWNWVRKMPYYRIGDAQQVDAA